MTIVESLVLMLFNAVVTITNSLIFYLMILGTMLIFSVIAGYPTIAAGVGPNSVNLKKILGKQKAFAGDYLLIEVKLKSKLIKLIPVLDLNIDQILIHYKLKLLFRKRKYIL